MRGHDEQTTHMFSSLSPEQRVPADHPLRAVRALIEFRKFLDLIEAAVPPDLDVHLILDNYSTHKTPLIHRWLAKRPRFHLHFTPTYSSWLNLVERWFAELTTKQLRRGTHRSVRRRPPSGSSSTPAMPPASRSSGRAPMRSWRASHGSLNAPWSCITD